ncbi:MAG: hypothetical protein WCF81_02820 [Roseiarcus sp.]
MQAELKRGNAAFRMHGVGLSVAILASATLSLSGPDRALAACGASSRPAGVHAAGSGAGGVHVASTAVTTSSGGSGGGGSLGCAGGSSASALHGLPIASSGRVLETGAHAARAESHARTATTRTMNTSAHLHAIGAGHRA